VTFDKVCIAYPFRFFFCSSFDSDDRCRPIVEQITPDLEFAIHHAGLCHIGSVTVGLAHVPIGGGLFGASITCRIATGQREGRKVFTQRTLQGRPDEPRHEVAESSSFSLHADIAAKADGSIPSLDTI
jgi:hypothetical protein